MGMDRKTTDHEPRERGLGYLRAIGTNPDRCQECSEHSFKLRFPSLGDDATRRFGDYLLPDMRGAVDRDGHIYITTQRDATTAVSLGVRPLCKLWRKWHRRKSSTIRSTEEDARRPGLDTTEGVSEVRDGAGTQPMGPVNGRVSKQNLLDAAWLAGYVGDNEVAKEVANRLLQDLYSKVKIL